MDGALIIAAFIAGILTFLAPCTFPLIPAYLGFISGVSAQELQDPKRTKLARRKIILNGLFFVFGFSLVFIILGISAGFLSQLVAPHRILLSRIGGVLIVLFGLMMLDVLIFPFMSKGAHIRIPSFLRKGTVASSCLLGASFGFGWTPCVGPILGSILTLAAVSATALEGGLFLLVFSLGLAIPFMSVAIFASIVATWVSKFGIYLRFVSIASGVLLILLGVVLLLGKTSIFVALFYRMFWFINYASLLDYL
ncbi:MAG: cytochrome c-type bioproteinis protein [Parcubacteria group bacterium Gr01-1014_48]|nr:MAG: cytochrome c-type bioproteinis protein [Parcubacteria group bacterium Greene0416_14]TSC72969.1 MAG: cytochrome c-type bioproteinis protein [Parcubacteria group bacterium Gr01-1014_48]TSC99683.1 MAG: cytochrome c-type bioproteinis protein [Parcubacteria group bacterium Greene1014_15]TSD06914.1 MAG: cytochrome c-type bioproteinis protein [Parcubacteria group bacterium Greene0714_4]